jgi:protein-S-isoprenylcysteine O-methyltransferase Ste14
LAHWLFIFAMAALTGYAANWILFVLDCLIIPLMILAEERELKRRYGSEFAKYMREVPRFFPSASWTLLASACLLDSAFRFLERL